VEFEQLVKVFFAEHATKADLLATLLSVRQWSNQRLASSAGLPQSYLDGTGPFPERLPWLILVGKFLTDFLVTVESWANWATGVVEGWPDDLAEAEPDWATLQDMAAITKTHLPEGSP
jgi:hypothetical protein